LYSILNANAQSKNTTEMAVTISIPAFALIDFSGGNHLIRFNSPNQVEQIITPSTLNNTWLNYSSIIDNGRTNYITVHISSGNLPPKSTIKLQISEDSGAGAGKTGRPSAQITLSHYPQNIITDIGSCYTGRGSEKGHQLTYLWKNIDDFSKSLYSKNEYIITVTYTISSTG
jgi:hypothetical protein